ncbi:4-deoxy-4-formamido-L-arabinose-phosphoundecapre nol deformylase [Desulfonema ishimotonii]|uniref:4-deoxy-4-formamido-L-arabinose-phosphoundecapre nol deformylase n=1 Tax=Desulfonema ishimotonii TaxID=45657 RepID=A0A401FSZ0_9BACT|nr:4-deoxy-4-formamido-L-arabinose-phosphoundecaprenol deformylase [Desulfonema ishimotonii]GBC60089.1 4-deoxy-4-formamido-L-arabinose-phosphoundecapre nol deformylase [Desulfonema ishimotonii]
MNIGLRIDADTFRGTRYGVPNLCRLFAQKGIAATFFFSVGPDNMGRHLRRLIRPSFLRKMLRSGAPGLYGWDILFRGTFRPGPVIGEKLGDVIRTASDEGHEIGLHAWDHHAWQTRLNDMNSRAIRRELQQGTDLLTQILGHPPTCSAVPAWRCNDRVLSEKEKLPFRYNSDCRGESIFHPVADGRTLSQPQIPVTLPTYDEVIGHNGISAANYNGYLLSLLRPDRLNVLTIHAEAEGIACLEMFTQFVKMAQAGGMAFVPLKTLLRNTSTIGQAGVIPREIPGRDGWVACQQTV